MLTHDQIWASIDALAKRYGYSPSGLARKAGLDATSFNKSKRVSPSGRERWPSTESISKILEATGADFAEFSQIVDPQSAKKSISLSLVSLGKLKEKKGSALEALSSDSLLEEFDFLDFDDDEVLALEVTDNSFEPLYKEDDILVVSPTATTRKGDRLVVALVTGEIFTCELRRRTNKTVEVKFPATSLPEKNFQKSDIAWEARIIWVKQ